MTDFLWFHRLLTAIGLTGFEIISSIDNAVVNSGVLATMKTKRARTMFFIFGGFFAVFVVRGVLPFVIFATANAEMSLIEVWHAMGSSNPAVQEAVEKSAPLLLSGGGVFLVILMFHWLFTESKDHFGFAMLERQCLAIGESWFHAISILLIVVVMFEIKWHVEPVMASSMMLSVSLGGLMFFITQGFKDNAERAEKDLTSEKGNGKSDIAKVIFLTIIDATFSVDGVVGAFAFTMDVPMILIGNGIGALVVMYLTVHNVEKIQSYVYLKTGAMYSIGVLGFIMIYEAFGHHVPEYVSPVVTFTLIGFFFAKSVKHNKTMSVMQTL